MRQKSEMTGIDVGKVVKGVKGAEKGTKKAAKKAANIKAHQARRDYRYGQHLKRMKAARRSCDSLHQNLCVTIH